MKKCLPLLAPILFIVCNVQAQIEKGTILLGGDLQFSKTNSKPDGASKPDVVTSIYIAPSAGTAINDNLVLGVTLLYSHSTGNTNNGLPTSTKSDYYGGGFFLRRYEQVSGKLYVFAESNMLYTFLHQTETDKTLGTVFSEYKQYLISAGLIPGITYAVSRRLMLEASWQNLLYAQYAHRVSISNGNGPSKQNDFSIGTSLGNSSFAAGFRFLLN